MDKSLRIALFVHSFPTISETFIRRQIDGLVSRGHQVHILADQPPSEEALGVVREKLEESVIDYLSGPRVFESGSFLRTAMAAGSALATSVSRDPGLALSLLRSSALALGSWKKVPRTLVAASIGGPFDLVHCHFGDIGLKYGLAAAYHGVPLVVSFYGYDASSYVRTRGRKVYHSLFDASDAVVALSCRMKEQLVDLGAPPDRVHVVHLGVNPQDFVFKLRRRDRQSPTVRLLSVARLVPKKGIQISLRAFAAVCRDVDQLQYDIIGDGPLRSELTELARELAIADRVRFLGAHNNQSVQRAMLDADIFLAPSLTGPDGDEEGTPTVLIEASSSGLPVISTLHSGIPEVVLDGVSGYLVPEGDVSALADRIRYLVLNPDQWAHLGHAGRRHVENAFDIHVLTSQLEAVYLSTLSQHERTPETVAPT